jgi:hypothetical protein
MTYLAFVLRRTVSIATVAAILGMLALLCGLVLLLLT